MRRYIDAERLIDDIRPFAEYDSTRSNKDWVRRFEIAIEAPPTADVVPMDFYDRCMEIEIQKRMNMVKVVRCKDCKHIKEEHFNIMPDGFSCELSGLMVEPEHYCSYGERAEE